MKGPIGQPEPRAFPTYVPCDLGTLGGESSCALAINERGQVVGWAETVSGQRHAVLWDHGEVLDLGLLPGAARSEAWDINDEGLIVGVAVAHPERTERAFVWHDGKVTELQSLAGPRGLASASAVNSRGQIVGGSSTGPGPSVSDYHAVRWEGDRPTDLGTLPEGLESHAWDINDAAQVVGAAQNGDGVERAVLWSDGRILDLGTLDGIESVASAINERGWIAGTARTSDGSSHAFLWRDGVMSDLGALPGGRHSRAYDLNDVGQIVGSATRLSARGPQDCAAIWCDGQLADLNDLVDPDMDTVFCRANGINSRGQIVGQGVIDGRDRAFLLTPKG
jgi:probable HAF family extracellular repeat protein